MSAHTPGPWSVDPSDPSIIRDSTEKQYARGPSRRQVALAVLHLEMSDAERDDNARLIAAAPDLAEALRTALDTILTIGRRPDPDMEEEAVAQIRAALRKAGVLP